MIKFENVTYRYRDRDDPVLSDLTLTIEEGESICMMGANGSGKSTFARIVAGLLTPARGRVVINGSAEHPQPVGMLFQNPDNQMVAVTVEKEVAFGLENLGIPLVEMKRLVNETLQRFRIDHLRQRLTAELSGGEKQRVALASVMVLNPPILVLDEPDSFLDENGKATLREEMARIKAANPRLVEIRITQYPVVARMYPRLVVLDRGVVVADDQPSRIFADHDFCIRKGLAYRLSTGEQPGFAGLEMRSKPPGKGVEVDSVSFRNVAFNHRNGNAVLENISFTLKAGNILGLVGPSGSGKSTLGLLACGLLRPSSGAVVYEDCSGRSVPPEDIPGRVSGLFQLPERQFFLPTCAEEIAFGPRNLGCPHDPKTVAAFFALAGLDAEKFSGRDPFTLSGGEKRRLAFAAVLSMQPRLVVFDEPTCGLDQEGVGRFIRLGRALANMRVGLIIISHDGGIIHTLADRVLYLDGDGGSIQMSCREFFADARCAAVVSPVSPEDTTEQK